MAIEDNLDRIKNAIYGEDVRDAIHDAIEECYTDSTNGSINSNARNLLRYILERVAYTQEGMQAYVNALIEALAYTGDTPSTDAYSVINALTNITNSNSATSINLGDSYTATLTPDTDYTIDSVVITMGDVDITSTAYSNGEINIASVTGDIVITASATDADILYQLPAPVTFTGVSGERIYVEERPLETDSDFTMAVQFQRSTSLTNDSAIFQCMEGTSPYWGIQLKIYNSKYNAISYGVNDSTSFADFNPSSTDIVKCVVRHTAGTANAKWQMAGPSNNIYTATIGNTSKTITSRIILGGSQYIGAVNKFILYGRVLTDAEATAFLEDNS